MWVLDCYGHDMGSVIELEVANRISRNRLFIKLSRALSSAKRKYITMRKIFIT